VVPDVEVFDLSTGVDHRNLAIGQLLGSSVHVLLLLFERLGSVNRTLQDTTVVFGSLNSIGPAANTIYLNGRPGGDGNTTCASLATNAGLNIPNTITVGPMGGTFSKPRPTLNLPLESVLDIGIGQGLKALQKYEDPRDKKKK
jgi:hypothetical protein